MQKRPAPGVIFLLRKSIWEKQNEEVFFVIIARCGISNVRCLRRAACYHCEPYLILLLCDATNLLLRINPDLLIVLLINKWAALTLSS